MVFNNGATNYSSYDISFTGNMYQYTKKVQGTSELGFLVKAVGASATTYYCDHQDVYGNDQRFAYVGGYAGSGVDAGTFYFITKSETSTAYPANGARLMFL